MDLGSSHERLARDQLLKLDDYMIRMQRAMHRRVQDAVQNFHMTASQIFILRYLDKQGRTKASDIAKFAGLSPGAVTQVCDELVKATLVERTRSDDDRRVVYIEATSAGKERLEQIRQFHLANSENVLSRLGANDSEEFLRLLGRVVELVEAEVAKK